MKKILLSIATVAVIGGIVAGATGAWFTNTETSTGNTFTAGVIDLKVDNESYVTNNDGDLVLNDATSWEAKDLNEGTLFFDFADLKPGDVGEDTISLHIESNDAWACLGINVTDTPENGQTEPELLFDQTLGDNEGELQEELQFIFWADDGDNVLEVGEQTFTQNPQTLQQISDNGVISLADSLGGTLENGKPLKGGEDYFIGKAWCQGDLTLNPINDGKEGGPLARGTGVSCNGAAINDASQTDGVKVDVTFSVEQSRNNGNFMCTPPEDGELTVIKVISGGPITDPDDFDLLVDSTSIKSGETITVSVGQHTVSEDRDSDYTPSYSASCPRGIVNVPAGGQVTCTITNTYTQGNLTITKDVVGGPYEGSPDSFNLMVGGNPVLSGIAKAFPEGNYAVTEDDISGYTASYGPNCADGTVNVSANGTASCTITNTYTLAKLTVEKKIVGGPQSIEVMNFAPFKVNETVVNVSDSERFPVGTQLTVTENGDDRYTAEFSGACDENGNVTLALDDDVTCIITNTYNRATLTVDKWVTFSSDDTGVIPSDFTLHVNGTTNGYHADVTDGVPETDVPVGDYAITEEYTGGGSTPNYIAEYGQDCDSSGNITLSVGNNKTCRIINLVQPN